MQKKELSQCRLLRIAAAIQDKGTLHLLEDELVRFAVQTDIEIDCAKIGMDFSALETGFKQYDLCILDFSLLDANKELLEALYRKNPACLPVVFDARAEQICQCLALRPGGCISQKNLADSDGELMRLCLACARQISDGGRVLYLTTRQGIVAIPIRSILFCQSDLKYVIIVSEDGTRLRRTGKLSELAAMLPVGFVRVHQSFLINRDRVRAVRKDTHELLLDHGVCIPYSRAYQETVMQLFCKV